MLGLGRAHLWGAGPFFSLPHQARALIVQIFLPLAAGMPPLSSSTSLLGSSPGQGSSAWWKAAESHTVCHGSRVGSVRHPTSLPPASAGIRICGYSQSPALRSLSYGSIRFLSLQWLHVLIFLLPFLALDFAAGCRNLGLQTYLERKRPWFCFYLPLTPSPSLVQSFQLLGLSGPRSRSHFTVEV